MRMKILVVAILLSAGATAPSAFTSDQEDRLASAGAVLRELRSAPDKDIPEQLWDSAKCVAVLPSVTKAAFIVGGEYGKGVVSCKLSDGWSAPAFIQLAKGSFGLQLGAESIDVVLLVMNERGPVTRSDP